MSPSSINLSRDEKTMDGIRSLDSALLVVTTSPSLPLELLVFKWPPNEKPSL